MNLLDLARSALPAPTPAPAPATRTATQVERLELAGLLRVILPGDPEGQAEALAIALADADAALMSFRALAADRTHQGPAASIAGDPFPALPRCTDCRNLAGNGQCRAAPRRYSPTPDIGRRCFDFTPKPDDPDQRTGAERWPGLAL